MCLLIGPLSVGKTLLLKRLQTLRDAVALETAPVTIPTVGTNLTSIMLGRGEEVTVREIGGSMGPIWHNYFKETGGLIYMVDLSNRLQVSVSCIQLLTVLSHPDTQRLPVLIIFNKIDLPTVMSRSEVESLYKMEDIIRHSKQKISVLEVSAKSGQGLESVCKWIQQNYKLASPLAGE